MIQRTRTATMAALLLGLITVIWEISPDPRGLAPALHHPQAYVDRVGADRAAIALVCILCWIVLAWLAAGLALTAASALPGALGQASGTLAGWVLPATLRRAAALALGVSLATGGGAAGAMIATSSGGPGLPVIAATAVDWPVRARTVSTPPAGRADLDWPTGGTSRPRGAGRSRAREVVVLRGDSLWSIAARSLGAGAGDEQIAREWPRWYAANRQLIGPDPDLILPGQRLAAPPAH